MHYGGFVVHRGSAIFRDRTPADVEAGRFPCPSVSVHVAPVPQASPAGTGALLQSLTLDYKQEEEWALRCF